MNIDVLHSLFDLILLLLDWFIIVVVRVYRGWLAFALGFIIGGVDIMVLADIRRGALRLRRLP
jgi:hypothetical protein